ncbi:hypothetical protein C8R46DRAFT_1061907, partial [Mycena filopes]
MSEIPPSAKRKRTHEDAPALDNPTPVRSSKIWMPYGDIVLQAESTQFRVNRDVLARQSSVFKDMFSVPQPPYEPTIEGCPIVRVFDTAKDWELLLDVLYHPFRAPSSRPFPVVATMLRLGKKYDIIEAREDALSRIHFEYPADLRTLETRSGRLTKIDVLPDSPGTFVDMLNLLFECGIHSSIPALGLACLYIFDLETMLLTGVKREDDSVATVPADVFATLAVALDRMLHFQRCETLAWLKDADIVPHASCTSRKQCERQKMVINHHILVSWTRSFGHDLRFIAGRWNLTWSDKLCGVCEARAREHYETARQKGWELLPTFFGLPKWKYLTDDV